MLKGKMSSYLLLMKKKKNSSFLFVGLFLSLISQGQYQLNGDAVEIGQDTFQLTPSATFTGGAVWYKAQHILDDDFLVRGKMYFGTTDDGADGIAFVLQNECLASGLVGGGLGYEDFPGSSLGIEFDIYANQGLFSDGDMADPNEDHIAIQRDGNTDHLDARNLKGPVQMSANAANVEDDQWHDFEIKYTVSTTTIEVYFDTILRMTHVVDLKTDIFAGGGEGVFWGFTASTGSKVANHRIYIEPTADLSTDTITSCSGSSSTISFPEASTSVINVAANKDVETFTLFSSGGSPVPNNQTQSGLTVNENSGQRWVSSPANIGDSISIEIDLGGLFDVNQVIIEWPPDLNVTGKDMLIQSSLNGTVWVTQADITNNTNATQSIAVAATGVQFIRVVIIVDANGKSFHVGNIAVYADPLQYIWSPDNGTISDINSNAPIFTPEITTVYTVIIPDQCLGSITFEYTVIVVECPEDSVPTDTIIIPIDTIPGDTIINEIIVPTAFTPDNDGFNDEWDLSFLVDYPDAAVQVFNRWGMQVYTSKGGANYMAFYGDNLPVGSYAYIIVLNDSEGQVYKGNLSIVR